MQCCPKGAGSTVRTTDDGSTRTDSGVAVQGWQGRRKARAGYRGKVDAAVRSWCGRRAAHVVDNGRIDSCVGICHGESAGPCSSASITADL